MNFSVDKLIKLPDSIFDARYHPNNEKDLIAVATVAGNVHLIESGEITSKIKKHHKGSAVRKIRFLPDGRMVTIAKTIKVHDIGAGETSHTIRRTESNSTFYSVFPINNNMICAGDDDGKLYVWDIRTSERPVFSSHDCEQYISDIDGRFDARKLLVCTSGEGTLTAYDLRANKMIEPQSELFEAGFQCLRIENNTKKVVIGGEDGAIYIFNNNEWAHTSGKFALDCDVQNRGKCSVDCLDMIEDESVFLAGCSDGKLRAFQLWPHNALGEKTLCGKSSLESIHVNPRKESKQVVVAGDIYLNLVSYEDNIEEEEKDDEAEKSSDDSSSSSNSPADQSSHEKDSAQATQEGENSPKNKKFKGDNEDYLNIFDK